MSIKSKFLCRRCPTQMNTNFLGNSFRSPSSHDDLNKCSMRAYILRPVMCWCSCQISAKIRIWKLFNVSKSNVFFLKICTLLGGIVVLVPHSSRVQSLYWNFCMHCRYTGFPINLYVGKSDLVVGLAILNNPQMWQDRLQVHHNFDQNNAFTEEE